MQDLLAKIHKITSDKGLISGADAAARPGDWLSQTQCKAGAIVRPGTVKELSAVMKLCHAAGQPVIASGGLTNLVHSTDAKPNEIMISMERMTGVSKVDPVGRTITAEAGAPLQKVQEAALEEGFIFPVDLGARGSATIGGNIATNAGGNQVIRYGMMRANILGLEAVLADGTVFSSLNTLLKNNAGYDLKQMFIGAEGTLGIVTRAVLKLQPEPKSEMTAIAGVKDFKALTELFAHTTRSLGGNLTAFEVMWKEHYDLIAIESGRHTPPIPQGFEYYVIIEANGNAPERDAEMFETVLGEAFENKMIADAAIASSKAHRQAIWNIREDIEGLFMNIFPAAIFDVSMPIDKMEVYFDRLKSGARKQWGDNVRVIVFGHLGDGNLHIGVAPRPWNEEARKQAEHLVYEPLQAIGGSISAEHGIGLEKRDYLHFSRSPVEIQMMKTLKAAFDPKGILNPGKIFTAD